jgi:broad specificity phosphatase PhoE
MMNVAPGQPFQDPVVLLQQQVRSLNVGYQQLKQQLSESQRVVHEYQTAISEADKEIQKLKAAEAKAAEEAHPFKSMQEALAEEEEQPRIQFSKSFSNQSAVSRGRPRRLIFIRHGESEANVNRTITEVVPDHSLHLTARGRDQALQAGERLKEIVGDKALKFVVSPYVRTRETLNGVLHAWGESAGCHEIHEEVRIREQEFGNFDSPQIKGMHQEKKQFGAFYYRFENGESAADCYDRASLFMESFYRSWEENTHETNVIVGHGKMILVTLMRMFRIPIAEYDRLEALNNTEFIVLERKEDDSKFEVAYTWSPGEPRLPGGPRMREQLPGDLCNDNVIWSGEPSEPPLTSAPRRPSTS